MTEEKRNGGGRISLQNVIALLVLGIGMAGGLFGVWGNLSAENARTKERIDQIEKRVETERIDSKADVKEIKQDVKSTNEAVQLILRKLDVMEAGAARGRRDGR